METKTKGLSVRVIAEVAIFTAIAFALDILQGGLWRGVFTNGGSIGLAMIPVLFLAYRRGFVPALISGIILAFIQMLGGIYVISTTWYNALLQVGLDYILAYPMVALAGIFFKKFQQSENNKGKAKWLIIGTVVGGLMKFACHFLAGVLFWQNFDFPGGPVLYSIVYNGGYMLPNIIISAAIIVLLALKQPTLFIPKNEGGNNNE